MSAIAAIRLVSRDAARLAAFYREALGFSPEGEGPADDPFSPAVRRLLRLRLGAQRIEIAEIEGPPFGGAGSGPDTHFQHFAMVAPRMEAAMARLTEIAGWTPITEGGPQRLPPRSGGVTAFKFRDPEGHPLEFLSFVTGAVPAAWRTAADDILLGIDHTAIVVSDTERSVDAYAGLGFRPGEGTHNVGPEQARLDGAARGVVDVKPLSIEGAGPPHLELLRYEEPGPMRPAPASDLSATRTILAGSGDVSAGWSDPDGHRWIRFPARA